MSNARQTTTTTEHKFSFVIDRSIGLTPFYTQFIGGAILNTAI